ncbi:MAG: YceI family protein [Pseudomonadota bacterium]
MTIRATHLRTRIASGLVAAPLLAALLVPRAASAEPVTFDLDPTHTTIAFFVDHIGYARTLGWFTEVSGSFVYNAKEQTVSDIRVEVNPASVFTNDERRDEHVRNSDFLDVENHATVVFTADGGEVTGETTGMIPGELTLLGETRPIEVKVTLNKDAPYPFGHEKRTVGVSAEAVVTRSEFGMDYALGGIVGDDVTVIIELEAIARD